VNKELIIRTQNNTVDFAFLKDGKLIELHREEGDNSFSVGDIFLAKVRKPVTGLNAAFVNVGYQKDAFLHYHDLGPRIGSFMSFTKGVLSKKNADFSLTNYPLEKEIDKDGSINDAIKANQSILVQIIKEPISTKGPRISSELSLAGRYVVMVPFSDRVSVSQKIESKKEKDRLKRLVMSIKPKGFGIIVRTVAEGQKVANLDADMQRLIGKWNTLCANVSKGNHPSKVLTEVNRSLSFIRDVFNESFTGIYADNPAMVESIKDYLAEISPKHESIVKLHKGAVPIYEKFGIDRQIKTSLGKTASMSKGAYLVIEHTEAMHVIDVNSGNRSNKANNQEDTALEVNLIAATEVARQLRLRDMGGIIVVDFIDMAKSEHRKHLYDHLREDMSDDRAKHKILPPIKFGLI
jgi:ribonuclease G